MSGPASSKYTFLLEPDAERCEYITGKLREFNLPRKSRLWLEPPRPAAPLEVYALDEQGAIMGGLAGETHAVPEWLNISVVWVAEEQRGQGIGERLVRLAEEEAQKRGCRYARLATGDYQAPDFYRRLGYREYGRLENCPRGETVYYFCKELNQDAP